ncbi:MAG: 16S rRNA (cytidine(1402)-2'-O)-methyltransferase [Firmicutes bacterium]|nr:16S rRNA (cytidine(1402)-2'-O)-methyltransferase [Bacillota bacterium]
MRGRQAPKNAPGQEEPRGADHGPEAAGSTPPPATGVLYVCATPIGNLEDLAPRAVQALAAADVVAAEDTRRTRQLLSHLQLHKRLVSYREENREVAGQKILALLRQGATVALASDAGTPAISDPGAQLVRAALDAGVRVVPIPGPSAVVTALSASGFSAGSFHFAGFLPRQRRQREQRLAEIAALSCPVVFYEAPHRLVDTLQDLVDVLGDRTVTIARELTKKFEEIWPATLQQALQRYRQEAPQGEFVLVVAGASSAQSSLQEQAVRDQAVRDQAIRDLQQRLAEGADWRLAVRELAQRHRLPRRILYQAAVAWRHSQRKPSAPDSPDAPRAPR